MNCRAKNRFNVYKKYDPVKGHWYYFIGWPPVADISSESSTIRSQTYNTSVEIECTYLINISSFFMVSLSVEISRGVILAVEIAFLQYPRLSVFSIRTGFVI